MGTKLCNRLSNQWVCQKIRKETVFSKEVNIPSITAYTLLCEGKNAFHITHTILWQL